MVGRQLRLIKRKMDKIKQSARFLQAEGKTMPVLELIAQVGKGTKKVDGWLTKPRKWKVCGKRKLMSVT